MFIVISLIEMMDFNEEQFGYEITAKRASKRLENVKH